MNPWDVCHQPVGVLDRRVDYVVVLNQQGVQGVGVGLPLEGWFLLQLGRVQGHVGRYPGSVHVDLQKLVGDLGQRIILTYVNFSIRDREEQ